MPRRFAVSCVHGSSRGLHSLRSGATPRFSSADAHFRIHCAMGGGVEDFVVQDLKGFFDHLHLQDILPLLRKLGAPACLEHLLTSIMAARGYSPPVALWRRSGSQPPVSLFRETPSAHYLH